MTASSITGTTNVGNNNDYHGLHNIIWKRITYTSTGYSHWSLATITDSTPGHNTYHHWSHKIKMLFPITGRSAQSKNTSGTNNLILLTLNFQKGMGCIFLHWSDALRLYCSERACNRDNAREAQIDFTQSRVLYLKPPNDHFRYKKIR